MKTKKMFSIYRKVKEVKPTYNIGIEELNLILKSDEMKRKIGAIRKADNKALKNQLKGELPLVTFSGEFNERRNTGLQCSSFNIGRKKNTQPYILGVKLGACVLTN